MNLRVYFVVVSNKPSAKILILDSYYGKTIKDFEIRTALNAFSSFAELSVELTKLRFGFAGVFADYFRGEGWNVSEYVVNSRLVQETWAREMGYKWIFRRGWDFGHSIARRKLTSWLSLHLRHLHWVALKQIEVEKPDLVLIQDVYMFSRSFLRRIKKMGIVTVGHLSSEVRSSIPFDKFDIILSSVPAILEEARWNGCAAVKLLPAFDPTMRIFESTERDIELSFVGTIYPGTIPVLQAAAAGNVNLQIYADDSQGLLEQAGLGTNYRGAAWGEDMYRVLGRSQLTLNRHGSIASDFAANMRLFEATGMGACLLTDWKQNMESLFESNECLTYRNLSELTDIVAKLSKQPEIIHEVAVMGQLRTLREHTFDIRLKSVNDIFKEFVKF